MIGRRDSEGHQDRLLLRIFHHLQDRVPESALVRYGVVGGSGKDGRVRVALHDAVGGLDEARACASGVRLKKEVVRRKIRNLLADKIRESGQGDNNDVLRGNNP